MVTTERGSLVNEDVTMEELDKSDTVADDTFHFQSMLDNIA